MTEKTFWLVELTGAATGEVDEQRVFDSAETLAEYVRLNAHDLHSMRIVVAGESNLVELRLAEAFAD